MEAGAAQAKALRAQAAAGGLCFEAYLPPRLAERVLGLIEDHIFDDPSNAISAILEDYRGLVDALDNTIPAGSSGDVTADLRARIVSAAELAHWRELDPSSESP